MNKKNMATADRIKSDIKVKLLPRSSMNKILGREGDHFKVKVTAPPVEGKANEALITLLSKKLGIPKGRIEIVSGKSSRMKSIRVEGLSIDEITENLEK